MELIISRRFFYFYFTFLKDITSIVYGSEHIMCSSVQDTLVLEALFVECMTDAIVYLRKKHVLSKVWDVELHMSHFHKSSFT